MAGAMVAGPARHEWDIATYVESCAAKVALLERRVERILIDDTRPSDVYQQRSGLHQGKATGG